MTRGQSTAVVDKFVEDRPEYGESASFHLTHVKLTKKWSMLVFILKTAAYRILAIADWIFLPPWRPARAMHRRCA
jgi:hypothetical protein